MKIMQKLLYIPLVIVIGSMNPHITLLIYLLFGSTIADFITGIIASWFEKRDAIEHNNKKYFIESHKLRKSVTKVLSYMFLIIATHFFSVIFNLNKITIPIIKVETTLVTIAFSICILIEVYSVIENLNRMGFDLFGEIKKVISKLVATAKYLSNTKKTITESFEEKVEGEL